jgi:DNA-binding IclR family transcriptional regulator
VPHERLTIRDLADRADVSTQTVRNHRDVLEALSLIRRDESGRWRLTLAFHTADERHRDLVPDAVRGEVRLTDAVSDVLAAVLPADESLINTGHTGSKF